MQRRTLQSSFVIVVLVSLFCLSGCATVPSFPDRPARVTALGGGRRLLTFDTDAPGWGDYRQLVGSDGRKVELRYLDVEDGTNSTVRLDNINWARVPHFVIALDGVPFELVEELYDAGSFRLFAPPSRVISCFPSMTDLAFSRIFNSARPLAYEAEFFDRQTNSIVGGNDVYLSGANADWANRLGYRCSFTLDALAYLFPKHVFDAELRGMNRLFKRTETGTAITYSVATAGLGTRGGRSAMLRYLRRIDSFCEQLVYERRGRVKITLIADHAQNMNGRCRVTFHELLAEHGYRVRDHLDGPRDVVSIKYGLITSAAFYTDDPAGVTTTLLRDPVVELACYPVADAVIVRTLDGKAAIRSDGNNYSYDIEYGDPLALSDTIESLQQRGLVDEKGFIDDRALFDATVEHAYPDPLRRLWLAFHSLVRHPADMVITLHDGWCHGSKAFHVMIGGATSTHGSLNRINSTTFAMTMWGQLPPAMRLEEVMPAVESLRQQAAIRTPITEHLGSEILLSMPATEGSNRQAQANMSVLNVSAR